MELEPEPRQWTEAELALVSRVYDESRNYVEFDPGMENQIYRNGLLPKKTRAGDGHWYMEGSKQYYRDDRSNTPEGALIIHKDDPDPKPGTCDAFIHPPLGCKVEYRGENNANYHAQISLAELAAGSQVCEFCSILHTGIQRMRPYWIFNWAKLHWFDAHTEPAEANIDEQSLWIDEYWDEIGGHKSIGEEEIFLRIEFPKGYPYVHVSMQIGPHPLAPDRPYPYQGAKRRPIADLEYYTSPGCPSPSPAFGAAPHIQSELLTDDGLEQLLSWIHECRENHVTCIAAADLQLPSRLLKLTGVDSEGRLEVHLEDTDPTLTYQYIALSHCWAKTDPLKITKGNLATHRSRVPWNQLSVAFLQALQLTGCLGLEYLWIDALCIIQNDNADWESESPRMSQIYGNAFVTFAIHGPDLCFKKRPAGLCTDTVGEKDRSVYCRLLQNHDSMFDTPSDTDTWFGRAWCLQERFFSPRLLHFGGLYEEITFECNHHLQCECGRVSSRKSNELPQTLKAQFDTALLQCQSEQKSQDSRKELWKIYIDVCEDYTAKGLTYATDTLPAISSLTKTLAPIFGNYW